MDFLARLAINFVGNGKLTVLNFHKIPEVMDPLAPDEIDIPQFSELLEYFKSVFNIVPLDEAIRSVMHGRSVDRVAALTFDDGYPSWRKFIAPLLLQHQVHATFFFSTGQINGRPLWNEVLTHAVREATESSPDLDWRVYGLHRKISFVREKRLQSLRELERFLKYQTSGRRSELLSEIVSHVGVDFSSAPSIGVDEIRSLHSLGFGIGAHSVSHPILKICDLMEARREIVECKEQLEGITRSRIGGFAYPNGIPGVDFSSEHVSMVEEAGYEYAVTTQRGFFGQASSRYEIPRFTPWGRSSTKRTAQILRNFVKGDSAVALGRVSSRRKVLMVAFHFPPQSGSSGVLRTLNNAKYLSSNGWDASVLTVKSSVYEKSSLDLLASIPLGVKVIRCGAIDAAKHLSIKGRYLEATALPDRWGSWFFFGFWKGLREIRKGSVKAIWSTYPISTAHLIAGALSKVTGTPWIIDFRDPMAGSGYEVGPIQRGLWRWLERYSVKNSKFCVFTTQGARDLYASRYPIDSDKLRILENGFDEELFSSASANRYGVPKEVKLVLHSGIVYPEHRDPTQFLAAISDLIKAGVFARERLRVRFRAPGDAKYLAGIIENSGLADVVEIASPLPYVEAVSEMLAADLLVILQGTHFNAQVPAKLYEYVRAQRDILGVVDLCGDTANKLREYSRVYLAEISSKADIFAAIEAWARTSSLEIDRSDNLEKISRYSRQGQAKLLAGLLDAMTDEEK